MFWVIVLPFKITCWVMLGFIAMMTLIAPIFKWKRLPTFFFSVVAAGILFIPVCSRIMAYLDSKRFGVFEFTSVNQIDDPHIDWAIPQAATEITIEKYGQGHRAKYTISESELRSFIEQRWASYPNPAVTKEEWYERGKADAETMEFNFGHLPWSQLNDPIELNGPMAGDGAGVTYYFEDTSNTVYHRASYF